MMREGRDFSGEGVGNNEKYCLYRFCITFTTMQPSKRASDEVHDKDCLGGGGGSGGRCGLNVFSELDSANSNTH